MEIYLLPLDLARWDQGPGGDLLVVPVWNDVRPLRGAAGLLDWRMNGRLSDCLREERFVGERGDRLLLPTKRLRWRAVLALGLGAARDFDEERFRDALETIFGVMRGLGLSTGAAALPGRELGRLEPERAATLFREGAQDHEHVAAFTLLDTGPALKIMGEVLGLTTGSRAMVKTAAR